MFGSERVETVRWIGGALAAFAQVSDYGWDSRTIRSERAGAAFVLADMVAAWKHIGTQINGVEIT
jgi:hypothetical protein